MLNHPPIPSSVWFSQTSSAVPFSALECLPDGSHHFQPFPYAHRSFAHTPGWYVLSLSQAVHTSPVPFCWFLLKVFSFQKR